MATRNFNLFIVIVDKQLNCLRQYIGVTVRNSSLYFTLIYLNDKDVWVGGLQDTLSLYDTVPSPIGFQSDAAANKRIQILLYL